MDAQPSDGDRAAAATPRSTARASRPTGARLAVLLGALLVLATLAVHARALTLDFVDLDDVFFVVQNPMVNAGFTAQGVRSAFTEVFHAQWQPVVWLSYMLDVELFGLEPRGFHATSVVLHAVNVLLFFGLAWRIGRRPLAAALAAALFALHPLHVESVAWISSRKDLWSALFGLLALHAYLGQRAPDRPLWRTPWRYAGVLVLFELALMSKAMLVTLPCLLLVCDVWPLGRWRGGPAAAAGCAGRRALSAGALALEKLPFLALAAVSSALVHGAVADQGIAWSARIANALVAYARYLAKAVWPADLAAVYPHPALTVRGGWGWPTVALAVLLLLALSAGALAQRRRRPYLLFAWVWFLGTLVPVIGLVQLSGHAMADRYAYLPLLGPYLALGLFAAELAGTRASRTRAALALVALAGLAALARTTWLQIGTWRDPVTLWTRSLAVTEHNYVAHANLGRFRLAQGDLAAAERHFSAALADKPGLFEALVNLGVVFQRQGDALLAREAFLQALEREPDDVQTRVNLASACVALDRLDEALEQAARALASDPGCAAAELVRAVVHERRDEPDGARAAYLRALALDPADAGARASLGRFLLAQGESEAARAELERALALDPARVEARVNLALALDALGERRAAAAELEEVVARAPGIALAHRRLGEIALATGDLPVAARELERALAAGEDALALHRLLVTVYERAQDDERAVAHYQAALALEPESVELVHNLGVALTRLGRGGEAADLYRRALKLDPGLALAHQNLALLLQEGGQPAPAIEHYRAALALDAGLEVCSDNLAWLLATEPDATLRDGAEALAIAEELARRGEHGNADHLRTLAVAYAEVGRFDDALRWLERAIELGPGRALDDALLARFRAGLPYRSEG